MADEPEVRERESRTESGSGEGGPAETGGLSAVLTPPPHRRFVDWIFVTGNRRAVTLVITLGVGAVLIAQSYLDPIQVQQLLTEETTVQTLFITFLSGVILLVSIVSSINSLVVQQELAPIGSQHERVIESWDFREEAARLVRSDVTPASPSEFLRTIVVGVGRELDELEDEISGDSAARDELEDFLDRTRAAMERTAQTLTDGSAASVGTTLFGPAYDPSEYIDDARLLQAELEDVGDATAESFDDIVAALQYFATAREYFKTVYYKREFAHLSRDLLYTGIPAILTISYVVLALDAQYFVGRTLGLSNLLWFFVGSYLVALLPFFVLTAYFLRAAVIAENTVTAGGFILEE